MAAIKSLIHCQQSCPTKKMLKDLFGQNEYDPSRNMDLHKIESTRNGKKNDK